MLMAIITMTTDFGTLYPASMKGVVMGINPKATIVDISHSIPPANIRAGAFALYSVIGYFPSGSIHVAVIDPGVGTERKALVVRAGEQYLVGPDNGLLIPAAKGLGDFQVYEVITEKICSSSSFTFHGRDIFAPVAAHISAGMDLGDIARPLHEYVDLDFSGYEIQDDLIRTKVIYVDDFGNIVTNIPHEQIVKSLSWGAILSISGIKMPFMRTYGEVAKGRLLSLVGSHGFFEIAVNQGNASKTLRLNSGKDVHISVLSYK